MDGSALELHNLDDDIAVLAQAFLTTVLRLSRNPVVVNQGRQSLQLHLLQLAALLQGVV